MNGWRLGAWIAAVAGLYYFTKKVLLPDLPIALATIKGNGILDIVLFFEVAVLFIVLGGFILQEFIGIGRSMYRAPTSSHDPGHAGSRWSDLAFLFVAIFGSGGLYAVLAIFVSRNHA